MNRRRPLALMLGLALMSGPAIPKTAWAKGIDPKDAATKRDEIVEARSEDPREAIEQLSRAGEELGDPELFLLAARTAYDAADEARDTALAEEAADRARVAQDIGAYLADERNFDATDWRPVTRERAAELAEEAGALVGEAEALIEEIEAERAAAEAEAERQRQAALAEQENKAKRARRAGTGMIAGGSAALVIGVGGIGMLGAGVAMGQARQREAEGLTLPDDLDRLDELDRQGAQANAIAYVGGVMAGVGIAVGVALVVVGVKKRKAAGVAEEAGLGRNRVLVGGWLERESGGLAIQGRF